MMIYKTLAAVFAACGVLLASGGKPPIQTADFGRIDRHYVYSPQMRDTITVDVWLPPSYGSGADSLNVVYMHDGQNLFDRTTTWNHQTWNMDSVATALSRRHDMEAPLIVGIHSMNATRIGDLMPVKALEYYSQEAGGAPAGNFADGVMLRGDSYADFVAGTLKPMIDSLYSVKRGMEHTSVMGSSMGGLMSVYMLCEYPSVFGNAACLSTHWAGKITGGRGDDHFGKAMYDYLAANLPRDGRHRIYFDRGTETIDALYGYWDDKIINLAETLGYTRPGMLDSFVDQGASHEENSWERRAARPLRFVLSPPAAEAAGK